MLSRLRARVRVLAPVVVLAVLATGCGVPLQDAPVVLQTTPAPSPTSPTRGGARLVTVYLTEEARLVSQPRSAGDTSGGSALRLLTEGPVESETESGMTTAVAPGDYAIEDGRGLTTVIKVPLQFTQITGDLQLLAAAQLVWTVTGERPRGDVRMTFEGEVIDVPTDRGLTSGPVSRSDYASVAPEDT